VSESLSLASAQCLKKCSPLLGLRNNRTAWSSEFKTIGPTVEFFYKTWKIEITDYKPAIAKSRAVL